MTRSAKRPTALRLQAKPVGLEEELVELFWDIMRLRWATTEADVSGVCAAEDVLFVEERDGGGGGGVGAFMICDIVVWGIYCLLWG